MPASQVEVGCPWARGLQPQLHPKAEEHSQAYQPATQPRAPPRPAPHYSTRHTEAEAQWKKNEQTPGGKKKAGRRGRP